LLACLNAAPPVPAADLRRDEQVVFIPSAGSPTGPEGAWEMDIHAWALEAEARTLGVFVFRKALGLDKDALTEAELDTFTERARWFLVDNERGKPVSVWLDGKIVPLGRTEPDGRLRVRVKVESASIEALRKAAASAVVPFSTVNTRGGAGQVFHGEAHLLEAEGLSVVSDVDDTIKISEVRNRRALLHNTFVRPFRAVDGMAATYRAWMTNEGAQFHFVTASPIQLYVPLAEFARSNAFPAATWHLKDFRWKDETFFDLFRSSVEYKLGVIEPLLQRFPQRRFVLVGDSGEKDPEIYATLARKYPQQIHRVLIRDVTDEPIGSKRYQTALRGLDAGKWTVFKDAATLPRSLR
jgi:hypothetical protein